MNYDRLNAGNDSSIGANLRDIEAYSRQECYFIAVGNLYKQCQAASMGSQWLVVHWSKEADYLEHMLFLGVTV